MKDNLLFDFKKYIHNQFRKNETKIHELNYLFWECTLRCNLSCLHCGSDCSSDHTIPDMPFSDFMNAVNPLKEKYRRDSITVVFTGGEPLLRNDLADCGKTLRENGFRWGIVTNGLIYNEKIHGLLLGAGMGAITISIDGLEDNHNRLRGNKSSFKKVINALELITSSGRLNYDVVTCVHPGNIQELPELGRFLILNKVKAWRLFTIAPIGRAKIESSLQLNSDQIVNLMEYISGERKKKTIDIKFSCEAYTGKYEKKVRDSFFFCRAGINIASILIDGSISACPNINRNFVQGNIYKERFIDVWNNKFELMRNRRWTKTGVCLNCMDYNDCNGGAMHLWNEERTNILNCINKKILCDLSEKKPGINNTEN